MIKIPAHTARSTRFTFHYPYKFVMQAGGKRLCSVKDTG